MNDTTNYSTDPSFQGQIMYKNLWLTLYNSYQILGAKLRIRMKPSVYPSLIGGPGINTSETISSDSQVPLNAQPGYYYARVFYKRQQPGGDINRADWVGHPIHPVFSFGPQADKWHEDYWPHERDFLSDSTVTWKRDTSSIRTKIHWHRNNVVNPTTAAYEPLPSSSTSYELECSNRPVTLTVKFSAKKHFMMKDALRNGYWNEWNSQLDDSLRFYVRFGYIGFHNDGTQAYHIPIDRVIERVVDIDISYFAALRDPLVQPTMYNTSEGAAKMELEDMPMIEEDDEDDEDDEFTDEEELTKSILPTDDE
ncbi:MAG: hypothetical protein QXJ97_12980 [Desulfurococcaceae archaeon]